jgi:membrane peptidoglycan carboxypeptidase
MPLRAAVVHAEDKYFFRHSGFYGRGIRRAFCSWVRQGRIVSGGSTISQQLARNLYLTPHRTVIRKTCEAFITIRLERMLSKERILELYLNVIEWGLSVWGCDSASRHYFAKAPSEIGFPEAAFMASRISAPRMPLSAGLLQQLWRRQVHIMAGMYACRLMTESECIDGCLRLFDLRYCLSDLNGEPATAELLQRGSGNAVRHGTADAVLRYLRSFRAERPAPISRS